MPAGVTAGGSFSNSTPTRSAQEIESEPDRRGAAWRAERVARFGCPRLMLPLEEGAEQLWEAT